MKRFYLNWVFFLFLTHFLFAQKENLKLKSLSVEQGLSANYSTVLLQDHLGFIWIGTTNGLNKYNAHNFTVYRTAIDDSTSIGGNFITALEEDPAGNIWIGTMEGGLSKYNRSKNSFVRYTHQSNNPNSLSHNSVRALIIDDETSKIWVGTQNGLDLFDPLKDSFVHFRHEPENKNSLTNEELLQSQDQIARQRDLLQNQRDQLTDQNKQLQEARKAIEEHNKNLDEEVKRQLKEILDYNQQLEQFAYISAHNLRAPVARILGLGQLLKIGKISEEEKSAFTDRMVSSAEDLDQVVKDLSTILALKKNSSLTLKEVNLNEELELVKSNLKEEIQETGTRIHMDFSEVNSIKTVKPYLDSILYNLISNAIKYRNPTTTPRIDIKTENMGDFVCLQVRDNGLGIDLSKYNKKLFSLYQRFHSHVEGKGMGLYLVKTQIEAMGGKVQVESEPEKGTIFKIYLKKGSLVEDKAV